jgi:N-acyl-D-amino-acid deacylase
MLDSFQKARQEGYDIAYDMYPFTYGASVITVVLPSWYMALTPEEKKSPFNRLKLKLIITVTKKLLGVEFSDMMISYIGKDYPQYEGKTVTEIAKIEQKSDFDMYLTLVDLSHGEGRIMFGKYYNEEIIHRLMQDPLTIYMTDAWVESTGTQNGGAFQAFPYFIKRAQDYEMPLEVVIHKMTGLTAQRFQIPNRGLIKVGNYADFTIFNPSEISIDLTDPSAIPTGIHYVIVNGQVAIKKSQYQKVTAGCVVLKKKSS